MTSGAKSRLTWFNDRRELGAVDLSRLFLPPFIGYFDKAEAMSFSHSPQIAYNSVKIAKKRGP
ncbi:hypothetical protein [Shewanella sp. Bg11-22]|uniref:hypothetical protein n=1 Tax=Shewanella sp. Bg11-22 TaxID=2058304 RepID=UPI0012FED4D7|nr:hypothetical protein [Shewanella sp. Bg11-22]